jgi:hypothetical protein
MTLLLRRSEVTDLLDLPQAMRVLEQTFREQADGKVKQVPPLRFMNRGMRMVVGGLEAQNKNGFRVSVTGGESVALLFEISSGDLISVMVPSAICASAPPWGLRWIDCPAQTQSQLCSLGAGGWLCRSSSRRWQSVQ